MKGTAYSYHWDILGSTTVPADPTGAVQATYRYDAFGNQIRASGSVASSYRYTAREWDAPVGLSYHRAGYYDPTLGRFLSRDPWGMVDGPNPYAYAGDNPVNFADPSGTGAAGGSPHRGAPGAGARRLRSLAKPNV